jgi:hypothetical protein
MVQPFLTAASLDVTARICILAFAVAIPLLAALMLLNRQEAFRRRRRARSVVVTIAQVVAQVCAYLGVVAGFWHILWIAGWPCWQVASWRWRSTRPATGAWNGTSSPPSRKPKARATPSHSRSGSSALPAAPTRRSTRWERSSRSTRWPWRTAATSTSDPRSTIAKRIQAHPELAHHGAGFLLYVVLDELVDSFVPTMDKVGERVEDLGEAVFAGRQAQNDVLSLRRDLVTIRRPACGASSRESAGCRQQSTTTAGHPLRSFFNDVDPWACPFTGRGSRRRR